MIKSRFARLWHALTRETKTLFWSGLLTLLPLALTIGFFTVSVRIIRSWFKPLYLVMPEQLQTIPLAEFLIIATAALAVGAILKFFLLHPLVEKVEHIFHKIPLLRPVYFGIKQLVSAFSPHETTHFQHVVLIEFPRKGVHSIGFITSKIPKALAPRDDTSRTTEHVSIFVPNTPNPTTGWYIILPLSECTILDITRQEAMTIIISGGIITPDRLFDDTATHESKTDLQET